MASCQSQLKGKVSGEFEVKSSSTALFDLYVNRPHHLPNVCSSILQSCHVEQGEVGKNGSLVVWKFNCDGKLYVEKEMLENVDVVNKSLTFRCVEGDILRVYKTFLLHLRIKPQTNNCNDVAQWTLEYEKLNESVDEPTTLLETALELTKRADACLLSNPTQN